MKYTIRDIVFGIKNVILVVQIGLYKEGSVEIGNVRRAHENKWKRFIDTFILHGWFEGYEIRDLDNNLKFKSKDNSKLIGKIQYKVVYYDHNKTEHRFAVVDTRKFNHSPVVKFYIRVKNT